MNWKGILGNGIVVPGVGGMKRQSRRSRRSAEPVDDVDARPPCYAWNRSACKSPVAARTNLDHSCTRASSDDSGRRADIEGVVPISSRPNDVHHEILITTVKRCRDRSGSQQARGDSQRLRSPFETRDVKRGEECPDLGGVDCSWGENVLESELEVVGIKVLWSLDQLVQ